MAEIEGLDSFRKLLELKKPAETEARIVDMREALQWRIPDTCKSDASKLTYTTYKVCDIARLPPRYVTVVGRVSFKLKTVSPLSAISIGRKTTSD